MNNRPKQHLQWAALLEELFFEKKDLNALLAFGAYVSKASIQMAFWK